MGFERERGRENGSFPVAEFTNRWVRGSEATFNSPSTVPKEKPLCRERFFFWRPMMVAFYCLSQKSNDKQYKHDDEKSVLSDV